MTHASRRGGTRSSLAAWCKGRRTPSWCRFENPDGESLNGNRQTVRSQRKNQAKAIRLPLVVLDGVDNAAATHGCSPPLPPTEISCILASSPGKRGRDTNDDPVITKRPKADTYEPPHDVPVPLTTPVPVKRGRGRPRKHPLPAESATHR